MQIDQIARWLEAWVGQLPTHSGRVYALFVLTLLCTVACAGIVFLWSARPPDEPS